MWHKWTYYKFKQKGVDTIKAINTMKYQNYSSKLIIQNASDLDHVIKSHGVYLFNMRLYQKFTVLKSTCKTTILEISCS